MQNNPGYLSLVREHFDRFLAPATAHPRGAKAMWKASLDLDTLDYPAGDPVVGKRVYRNIDAPRGVSLYWDGPLLQAAVTLSEATGEDRYAQSADAYIDEYLRRCAAPTGLLLWGNHYFYCPERECVLRFLGTEDPVPVDMATEDGSLHEARPLTPAWDLLWRASPAVTAAAIRAMGERHVYDASTGAFNRHADGRKGHAFLEAGGVLAESLAFLFAREGDAEARDLALRIARYSASHRGPSGLVRNEPDYGRWDSRVCTTEIGLWAMCLLHARVLCGGDELLHMAAEGVGAYLRHGWDERSGRYWGKLSVEDGQPVTGPKQTTWQPGDHSEFWEPLFPTHDYPFHLALACVQLYRSTGEAIFREGTERWAQALQNALPPRNGQGAYAEQYGYAAHFLLAAASALARPDLRTLAADVLDHAVATLRYDGLFRTHPGENRYDAVDGAGVLFAAMLEWDRTGTRH